MNVESASSPLLESNEGAKIVDDSVMVGIAPTIFGFATEFGLIVSELVSSVIDDSSE